MTPRSGNTIRLTLDINVQRAAERALHFGIRLAHANGEQFADGGAIVSPQDAPRAARAAEAHEADRLPGASSRWNAKKDLSWVPLRPELVCEVAFAEWTQDGEPRQTTFLGWRDDKNPEEVVLEI